GVVQRLFRKRPRHVLPPVMMSEAGSSTPSTTVFLLSPAHCGGRRAATLFRPATMFDLALRLRTPPGAPLGEVFSFVSGLYFRGKLAYAERFGRSGEGPMEPLVITGGWGLVPGSRLIDLDDLHTLAA